VIGPDVFFNSRIERLAALSIRHALPAIYQWREFTAAGGLLSYEPLRESRSVFAGQKWKSESERRT
jgi:hypothetical protein